jgi:TPR repeat protein
MDKIIEAMVKYGKVSQQDAELITESTVLSTIPNLDFKEVTDYLDYVFFNNHVGNYPNDLKTTCTLGELKDRIFGKSVLGSVLKPKVDNESEELKEAKKLHANGQTFFYADHSDCEGFYAKAAEFFQKAVEQGSTPAQFILGVMYFDGRGVKKDHIEAKKLIAMATEQGYTATQGSGDVQHFGNGDFLKEIRHKGGLLNCKHAEDQNIWGIMSYLDGNYAKAAAYFRESARFSNVYAQRSLEQMYSDGLAAQ